jgi:predicted house-cleaning NTP pyrophosphatase (Maf/HAM1 superfamily)
MDDKIFGKPEGREDAQRMLSGFSGKQHKVVTSIALYNGRTGKIDCRSASCTVHFARQAAVGSRLS